MDTKSSSAKIDLRPPPRKEAPPRRQGWIAGLLLLNLLAVVGLGVFLHRQSGGASTSDLERQREVAGRLLAAGAVDPAAELYGDYLVAVSTPPETRAKIAYSLGAAYLDAGRYEDGLRWLYEADVIGAGKLGEEVNRKIVRALERLGKTHAAEAALASRTRLQEAPREAAHGEDDPVVARVGDESFYRSDVERALEALPPEASRAFASPQGRQAFLQQFVAQEMLYRKARKQEIDQDPEVRRLQDSLFKQVVVNRLLEQELTSDQSLSRTALESYFEANKERYQVAGQDEVTLDQVANVVERDLRMAEAQEAYDRLVQAELAAADVELFPEAWTDHDG